MALFRKLFYKKPPDGLLEISERVYVFDCCFTTDAWEKEDYKGYVGNIIGQLKDHYPDASILIFNFREGDTPSPIASALSDYDMTIMDYPRHYEGCPLLSMEVIHHFLRSSESWLSLGQQNVLLMHCERGGWAVLAFMLAALLIYRKQYSGEYKTLDMVYKQAPRELLHLLSPLNPLPSQLRYLQYVSRRNVATEWPPLDRALTLDCVIIRMIPDFDGNGGCCPIFKIYGQDPFLPGDKTPKLLFSSPKRSKNVRHYKQTECELVKIDINCHIQGDIVVECLSLSDDMGREKMMYRAMFNTAFIRSNILMLNRDEIDTLWDAKDQFPKDFRAELLFSEMDSAASIDPVNLSCFEEKEGLPIEAFAKVQEIFNSVDWLVPKSDAALNVLHQIAASDVVQEKLETTSQVEASSLLQALTPNMYQDKESSSIENKPKSTSSLEKPSSPDAYTGGHMAKGQHVGGRSDLDKQQLPSLPAPRPPSPSKAQASLDGSAKVVSSSSLPSQPLSTCESMHSFLPGQLETRFNESVTSLLVPRPLPAEISTSGPMSQSSLSFSLAPVNRQSTPQHPMLNEKQVTNIKPPAPTPIEDPFHSSSSPPSHVSSKILVTGMKQPPLTRSTLPSSPHLKEFTDVKVGPPLPSPPPPVSHLIDQSSFPPSILTPSPPLKDTTDYKVGQSQPLPSPSTGPAAAPLKEQRGTGLGPPQPPSPPQTLPSPPNPTLMNEKGTRSGPPPAPPLPSTSFREDRVPRTGTTSTVPAPPATPPTPPVKEKSVMRAAPCPPPPPPPPLKEEPITRVGPSPSPPPPPPPPTPPLREQPVMKPGPSPPPPPPPPIPPLREQPVMKPRPSAPPPPPPPLRASQGTDNRVSSPVPPPPPPPAPNSSSSQISSSPPPPPPPNFSANGNVKTSVVPPPPPPSLSRGSNMSGAPSPPPPLTKGRSLARTISSKNQQAKKLKPLHWLKLTRAVQGSLWAEAQKNGEAAKAPEIDLSELESLFSASVPNSDQGAAKSKSRASLANKSEKVQLIDHRRAYNCEIMLSKVKIPLHELMEYVLALEDSAMDVDQVDNLIKFCPTTEEMELLKGYKGEKDKLGKCEQFFLELMKVPRTESKLRVFSFKLQFGSQVSDLRKSLNIVNSAVEEIRNSAKLKRVMQTILSLGNALNQGTARGSAIGFRLDSLLKLTETRARNNRMTLMHYLCKVLVDKLPEVLDFSKDLGSLEPASKIQLKFLAEEMQAISKGLEKVVQELSTAENDGPVSENFRKSLKEFLCSAEGEVRSLASLYSGVGKTVDALILYFGEDPARCPYEQVVATLLKFVRMFNQAHDENCKQLEADKKKAEKEASNEKLKLNHSPIESQHTRHPPIKSVK